MWEYAQSIRRTFWSEHIWLPPNVTWDVYKSSEDGKIKFAQFDDLYYAIITAFVLLCIRFTLERYVFSAFGIWCGLRPFRKKRAMPNAQLEVAFIKSKGRFTNKQIEGFSKQLDWSIRQVQRWYRLRLEQNKPTTLSKFCECSWRMTFYFFVFLFGVWSLYDKPWTWDSSQFIKDYPYKHTITPEVWWYYNLELGFYLSLLVFQFFDVKRKDFWQMFVHHIVTIVLLSLSWTCNFHRIGTLVLVIHDFADIPLEGAKLCRYVKNQKLSNIIFAVFTICWIFSRIGLLPYRVIAWTSYYSLFILPIFPAYYIFNGLLCILQILHIIWTWLILKVTYEAIYKDGVRDIRESDEQSCTESSSDYSEDSEVCVTSNGDKKEYFKKQL